MFNIPLTQLLQFTVLAAVVTTIGNLLATVLKEFLFARSFERWKERRSLLSVYRRYRDPILLAGDELQRRLSQICKEYPPSYLRTEVLDADGTQLVTNSADDPHYKKYRLLSTVYRLCAFLGWLEIYRQDVTFLETGQSSENERFETALAGFRQTLADGQLNSDYTNSRDGLVFRVEQRAIGEAMITTVGNSRVVVGYGTFCTLFGRATSEEGLWPFRIASNFFLDLEPAKDFRQRRLEMMKEHLATIIAVLRPAKGNPSMQTTKREGRKPTRESGTQGRGE
ncbi:MAG TPA: hypothetical protein VI386_36435 [Candidatus Sulfotelmatobacter sp.]